MQVPEKERTCENLLPTSAIATIICTINNMNLTPNNNDKYINDTIDRNPTSSVNPNQVTRNMKTVNRKYTYCKYIQQGKNRVKTNITVLP